jgi:hypothetical protein
MMQNEELAKQLSNLWKTGKVYAGESPADQESR